MAGREGRGGVRVWGRRGERTVFQRWTNAILQSPDKDFLIKEWFEVNRIDHRKHRESCLISKQATN